MTAALTYRPFAPARAADPYPHLAELRAAAPVHRTAMGFWLVTRHTDVAACLRSGDSVDMRGPFFGQRATAAFASAFTPRALATAQTRVIERVDAALDRIAAAGVVDLCRTLAFPLPYTVISDLLGMPPVDQARMRELTDMMCRSLELTADPAMKLASVAAHDELSALLADAVAVKRHQPADDVLTVLIDTIEDESDLVSHLASLYLAGHEYAVNLIANGVLALLRHPDQIALLRSRPILVDNAVEELLRYDAPVQLNRRITTAACPVRDEVIPAGSSVLLHLAAANRDETVFADADGLRLDRSDARAHLAFGTGDEHGIGALVARLTGRTAIGRLVARFPGLRSAGEPVWNGRINLRGLTRLPIAV